MRQVVVTALTLAALASGCGSGDDPMGTPSAADSSAPAPSVSASATPDPAAAQARRSAVEDVQEFAPALEQVFFSQGYPDDLAGALRTAEELTNLRLAPGNRIASYVFDAGDQEFRLCVESRTGAFAVYDTSPMSTISSGDSGGCP